MILKSIREKLNSSSGISILYSIMLFMVATLVSVLILASALTAMKRHENAKRDKQVELTLDSALGVISGYVANMEYTVVETRTVAVQNTGGVETEQGTPEYKVKKSLKTEKTKNGVTENAEEYVELAQMGTSPSFDNGAMTFEYQKNVTTNPFIMPQMLQEGLLYGILKMERTLSDYKSSENAAHAGVVYVTLLDPDGESIYTKLTYTISCEPTAEEQEAGKRKYSILFEIELMDKEGGNYVSTGKKAYLTVPAGGESAPSPSDSYVMEGGVRKKITTTTTTVTWQGSLRTSG